MIGEGIWPIRTVPPDAKSHVMWKKLLNKVLERKLASFAADPVLERKHASFAADPMNSLQILLSIEADSCGNSLQLVIFLFF